MALRPAGLPSAKLVYFLEIKVFIWQSWWIKCSFRSRFLNELISANPEYEYHSVFVFYLPIYCLGRVTFRVIITVSGSKGSTDCYLSSSWVFLDKKTLLVKIWLNPRLKLIIFRGIGPRCKTASFFLKISKEITPVSLSVFSLVPDLLFDSLHVLEYAKIRTVLQSTD